MLFSQRRAAEAVAGAVRGPRTSILGEVAGTEDPVAGETRLRRWVRRTESALKYPELL